MRLIGRARLEPLRAQDSETARWIANWITALRDAHWKRPADVTIQFPKAFQQDDSTFLFPVAQLRTEIQVLIAFPQGVALITAIRFLVADNER